MVYWSNTSVPCCWSIFRTNLSWIRQSRFRFNWWLVEVCRWWWWYRWRWWRWYRYWRLWWNWWRSWWRYWWNWCQTASSAEIFRFGAQIFRFIWKITKIISIRRKLPTKVCVLLNFSNNFDTYLICYQKRWAFFSKDSENNFWP